MSIIDFLRSMSAQKGESNDNVIDLSDSTKYPARVIADLNCTFSLGMG